MTATSISISQPPFAPPLSTSFSISRASPSSLLRSSARTNPDSSSSNFHGQTKPHLASPDFGAALRFTGGALNCVAAYVGEIGHGGVRGNHMHSTSNESFVIWGARTKIRVVHLPYPMMLCMEAVEHTYHQPFTGED